MLRGMRKKIVPEPLAPDLLAAIANAGMAVLIDRLGGSVVITQADRDAVARKYGGAVGVQVVQVEPGRAFRATLVAADPLARPPAPEEQLN